MLKTCKSISRDRITCQKSILDDITSTGGWSQLLLWNQRISLQSTVRQRSHSYTCTYLVIQHKRCTHTLGNRAQSSHTKCHTAYVALSVNVRGRFRLVVAVFGVVWYLLVPHPLPLRLVDTVQFLSLPLWCCVPLSQALGETLSFTHGFLDLASRNELVVLGLSDKQTEKRDVAF